MTGLLYGVHLPAMLGSAVVLQDVWEPAEALRLVERHRCTFTTAATPFVHGLTHSADLDRRADTDGRPVEGTELKIVDEDGAAVPRGSAANSSYGDRNGSPARALDQVL
ncbi:hypothetical protein GCM10023320_40840 [Pseudonocardia adelaidensis]|uniref:AMP-binding enzyme n=1 Tax=Pseudonocardia adelaidensis TaxID=648754 RepID=A0ABP9NPS8_9PSEU